MSAPTYLEARERVAAIADQPEREFQDGNGDVHFGALVSAADLRLVLSFPEGEREAVARVIDPSGWSYWDQFHDRHGHDYASQHIEPSLTKADRVINLLRGAPHDL